MCAASPYRAACRTSHGRHTITPLPSRYVFICDLTRKIFDLTRKISDTSDKFCQPGVFLLPVRARFAAGAGFFQPVRASDAAVRVNFAGRRRSGQTVRV
jgi:hypothetical protein